MTRRVTVYGIPIAQGSMARAAAGKLRHASAKLAAWREAVAWEARRLPRLEGPVVVRVAFFLPRGRTVRRDLPTVPPDLDKLCRAVGDALETAGRVRSDAQIVSWRATKEYGDPPRAEIEVVDLSAARVPQGRDCT